MINEALREHVGQSGDRVNTDTIRRIVREEVRRTGIMDPCIYTTQHEKWLDAASRYPTEPVCFRSAKSWATARQLLESQTTLPILFRQQDDKSTSVLACRFRATLVEIHTAEEFESDVERLAWLQERLWLQREFIKKDRSPQFPTWQLQFQQWEIDKFMKDRTSYIIRGLHEIVPLPLSRLHKLVDNRPLAPNFRYSYALCRYPEFEIKRTEKSHTAT